MHDYLVQFEDYLDKNIAEFIEEIENREGIRLDELKVKDLSYFNGEIISPAHGIYIFKTNKQILLVGKVRSNSFTERISKHFDVRPNAWFNRLLFIVCREYLMIERNKQNYIKASNYVFDKARLILINMKDPSIIDKFENILRGTTTTLNKFKHKKYDSNIILKDISKI